MILRLRLRTQLALLYAILFASLLGIAGFGVYRLMSLRLRADADDNLVDHMAGLWGYIRFTNARPEIKYDPKNQYQAYFLREATRYYQLYDARTGELLLESDDSALLHMAFQPADVLNLQSHPGIDTVYSQPVPVRFRSALFHVEEHPYLLRVGVTVEHDLADLEQLRSVLLRLFPVTTLLAILGAWWMAGRALRPVRDLQREASRISITRLDLRLRRNGTGDELDALAGTFNEVMARLDSGVQQMRNFAGYMAHELRTPMTVLRGETEVELMQPDLPPKWRLHLENHLEEFEKLQRLINRFLLLAKAETGALKLGPRSFDLSGMIREGGNYRRTYHPWGSQKSAPSYCSDSSFSVPHFGI
jgi:two-component system, OmpR family, sensor kinase